MGRKTESLPQTVYPVLIERRISNALPSSLVDEFNGVLYSPVSSLTECHLSRDSAFITVFRVNHPAFAKSRFCKATWTFDWHVNWFVQTAGSAVGPSGRAVRHPSPGYQVFVPIIEINRTSPYRSSETSGWRDRYRYHSANSLKRDFWGFLKYFIQHCFICRHSDSTVSEDAGIAPRTVTTLALTFRYSRVTIQLDLILKWISGNILSVVV